MEKGEAEEKGGEGEGEGSQLALWHGIMHM